jgi:hypothetical protein
MAHKNVLILILLGVAVVLALLNAGGVTFGSDARRWNTASLALAFLSAALFVSYWQ